MKTNVSGTMTAMNLSGLAYQLRLRQVLKATEQFINNIGLKGVLTVDDVLQRVFGGDILPAQFERQTRESSILWLMNHCWLDEPEAVLLVDNGITEDLVIYLTNEEIDTLPVSYHSQVNIRRNCRMPLEALI